MIRSDNMLKRTVTLTCAKCGKEFTYTHSDAVMPEDQKIISDSLCRKCRLKVKVIKLGGQR